MFLKGIVVMDHITQMLAELYFFLGVQVLISNILSVFLDWTVPVFLCF